MLDLIVFAALAIFVLVKLFNTLGKVDPKQEARFRNNFPFTSAGNATRDEEVPSVDISIVSGLEASLAPEIRDVFDQVRQHQSNFNAEQFIKGARMAFTAIVDAFTKADIATLKKLLSSDVFQDFKEEIERRKNSGYTYNTIVVGVQECEIVKASSDGNEVNISVRIVSDQINAVNDAQGNVLEGNPNAVNTIEDTWTFGKKLKSTSNIWMLVATNG